MAGKFSAGFISAIVVGQSRFRIISMPEIGWGCSIRKLILFLQEGMPNVLATEHDGSFQDANEKTRKVAVVFSHVFV